MNYVRHLNTFMSLVNTDKRLSAKHVSLYLALFYYWNFNRFHNPFSIYRRNLMEQGKIGSKTTYHNCLKELHDARYIYYHPGNSKFELVRISMVRLDSEQEEKISYKQLDLFSQNTSTENGTGTVPEMIPASPKTGTDTVPKLGHSINQTNNKLNSVQKTHTEIFEKNREINEKINDLAAVPNLRHGKSPPTIQEVEEYFQENNSTTTEANKFFHYNQAKNWMLTEKLPIKDWKALANKWMINSPHHKITQSLNHKTMNETIQQLYELYLTGAKTNKFILPEFCDYLQLEITEAIKQEAIQRRINQLSGSNETSTLNLWKAYMKEDPSDQLLINDEPNLIALAKRLAVSKHFQKLKSQKQTTIN